MPLVAPPTLEQIRQTNLSVTNREGTSVDASATAHVMGAWTSLIDPTNAPSYGLAVHINRVGSAGARRSALMNIGFGVTGGGGTIRTLIPFLDVGGSGGDAAVGNSGKRYTFPIYIPTGVRVQAQAQSSTVSDNHFTAVYLLQKPLYPFIASRWETYGEDTAGSMGTSVTPGSGAFGSWTQIPASSTTTRPHYLWHVGYDFNTDTTVVAADLIIEIGHGPSDPPKSIGVWQFTQTGAEAIHGPFPDTPIYHPVPSGQQLWARIASAETEVRKVLIHAGD